jgi:ABC-type nickel/cobalt efflux system permease component RcnA
VKRLALLAGLLAALTVPAGAQAHPLGNFTVNRYSAVEASGDRVYVKYVLDLAEIPAYQEGDRVRRTGFAREIARGLELDIDGRPAVLRVLTSRVNSRPGAGGLATLRFEAILGADRTGSTLRFRDTNYAGRIGWRELVVRSERGARIVSSNAPATSISDELRAYPKDLLSEPLDISVAEAELRPASLPGRAPELADAAPATRQAESDGFAGLIAQEDLGVGVILVSLGLAFFWGAAHALSPGHGKAIVTAYLVGQRGAPRHAAALGLIVTATHTVGVFALGLVTLALSQFIVPEQLYPWIGLVSGLLVIGVGASVLLSRVRHRRAHRHGHDHHHHHHGGEELGWRSLTAVGISGGLLPCPSALVVLLAAISLHRVALGLLLIVAFSAGLAISIAGIGLAAILAKRTFGRFDFQGRVVGLLPAISALVIVIAGAAMTVRALPKVG